MNDEKVALVEAYNKGYRVTEGGRVIGLIVGYRALQTNKSGYQQFVIRVSALQRRYTIPVHRLAAYQKFGRALFENGIETRHLNDNRLDNRLCNIGIGTHLENMSDTPVEKRREAQMGRRES